MRAWSSATTVSRPRSAGRPDSARQPGRAGAAAAGSDRCGPDQGGHGARGGGAARPAASQRPALCAGTQALWRDQGRDHGADAQEIDRVAQVIRGGQGSPYPGKKLFAEQCGKCHKLFGKGGSIGPDLTSYKRDDLDNMLLHIVNPSAEIREGLRELSGGHGGRPGAQRLPGREGRQDRGVARRGRTQHRGAARQDRRCGPSPSR